MELKSENVRSKPLGHLGLVAATINRLGIIEKIDTRLSLDETKGGIVSYGKRTAAMILNGLGFVNSRLYMSQLFFHDKPVSTLLGPGITSEHLNDDCLGRALDKISEYGTTKLFSEIAFEVAHEQGLLNGSLHLDTTSLTLYGEYTEAKEKHIGPVPSLGHSKAHRPDLKQVILSMTQMGPSHLPVWMEDLNGNTSDKKSFHETVRKMKTFCESISNAPDNMCFVVDGAFYNQEKLNELSSVNWITRVPASLKTIKSYYEMPAHDFNWELIEDERYKITNIATDEEAKNQRWIMVHSEPAYHRERQTLIKRMDKAHTKAQASLWHLSNEIFGCESDAIKAATKFTRTLKYFQLEYQVKQTPYYEKKGRPKKDESPAGFRYQIQGNLASDLDKTDMAMNRLGRFVLATNVSCESTLSNGELLSQYKEQTHIEAGFKFIKDSTFELDNIFLKSQRRIGALMMIMTLCLMVYNFSQYNLREMLKSEDETLPNQLGKPVKNPTTKWIFELMATIAVVEINNGDKIFSVVTNIHSLHKKIISYYGEHANTIYGLPVKLKPADIELNPKTWLKWCGM